MAKKKKPILHEHGGVWVFELPAGHNTDEIWDAYEEAHLALRQDEEEGLERFRRILAKHPYHFDSLGKVAMEYLVLGHWLEAEALAEKGYRMAMSLLPEDFDPASQPMPWGFIENRPFLRILQTYGIVKMKLKRRTEAFRVFELLLALNPDDNQGMRYLVLTGYFEQKDYEKARELLASCPDDWSMEFLYGRVAMEVLDGNLAKAKSQLKKAREYNPLFVAEMQRDRHAFPELDFDETEEVRQYKIESYHYYRENKKLYKRKELVDFYEAQKA